MACFKLLSLLCVFLLLQSTFATKEATKVGIGCHNFIGTVKCKDGSSILPDAMVQLYEDDLFGDDFLETKKLEPTFDQKSATFSWRGCYKDGNFMFLGPKFGHMELYYVFKNVCFEGDEYHGKDVLKDKTTYILHRDEGYLL